MRTRLHVQRLLCLLLASVVLVTPGCMSAAESAQNTRTHLRVGMQRAQLFEFLGPPDSSVPDAAGVMWSYEFGGDAGRRLAMLPEVIGLIVVGIVLTGIVLGVLVLMIALGGGGGGGGSVDLPAILDGASGDKAWRPAVTEADFSDPYAARIRVHLAEGLIDWLSPVEVR